MTPYNFRLAGFHEKFRRMLESKPGPLNYEPTLQITRPPSRLSITHLRWTFADSCHFNAALVCVSTACLCLWAIFWCFSVTPMSFFYWLLRRQIAKSFYDIKKSFDCFLFFFFEGKKVFWLFYFCRWRHFFEKERLKKSPTVGLVAKIAVEL